GTTATAAAAGPGLRGGSRDPGRGEDAVHLLRIKHGEDLDAAVVRVQGHLRAGIVRAQRRADGGQSRQAGSGIGRVGRMAHAFLVAWSMRRHVRQRTRVPPCPGTNPPQRSGLTWVRAPPTGGGQTAAMHIETVPLPRPGRVRPSPAWLAHAPHRLMFFIGAANVLLAMLWWALWLVSARWGAWSMPELPVPAGWLHAFLMQYLVLPSFVFGFL